MNEVEFFRWAAAPDTPRSVRVGAGEDPDGSLWATRHVDDGFSGKPYDVQIRIRLPNGPTLPVLPGRNRPDGTR